MAILMYIYLKMIIVIVNPAIIVVQPVIANLSVPAVMQERSEILIQAPKPAFVV